MQMEESIYGDEYDSEGIIDPKSRLRVKGASTIRKIRVSDGEPFALIRAGNLRRKTAEVVERAAFGAGVAFARM